MPTLRYGVLSQMGGWPSGLLRESICLRRSCAPHFRDVKSCHYSLCFIFSRARDKVLLEIEHFGRVGPRVIDCTVGVGLPQSVSQHSYAEIRKEGAQNSPQMIRHYVVFHQVCKYCCCPKGKKRSYEGESRVYSPEMCNSLFLNVRERWREKLKKKH